MEVGGCRLSPQALDHPQGSLIFRRRTKTDCWELHIEPIANTYEAWIEVCSFVTAFVVSRSSIHNQPIRNSVDKENCNFIPVVRWDLAACFCLSVRLSVSQLQC